MNVLLVYLRPPDTCLVALENYERPWLVRGSDHGTDQTSRNLVQLGVPWFSDFLSIKKQSV